MSERFELEKNALLAIEAIVCELYGEGDDGTTDITHANPDKKWDADTIDAVAFHLHAHGFGPGQENCPLPVRCPDPWTDQRRMQGNAE